jgi:endonuclease-3
MKPAAKITKIAARLRDRYGSIEVTRRDPVEELVLTILSQNTNDRNRDRAYAALMERFGSLAAVKDASPEEIAAAIRVGGLHHRKGERIKQVLARIAAERGKLDLSFLGELPLDAALSWLLSFPGVGRKTAGIVLLFSFGKPYFPVDTHIARVTRRLGLVGPKEDPHAKMNALLPPDPALMAQLHLGLIRLGRELCSPRRPKCSPCPLCDLCPTAASPCREEGEVGQ